jgi:hypothetical protein
MNMMKPKSAFLYSNNLITSSFSNFEKKLGNKKNDFFFVSYLESYDDPDLNLKTEFEKIEQAYRETDISKHGIHHYG